MIFEIHSYEIQVNKNCQLNELNNTNMLLTSWDQSALKSQVIIRLEEQTSADILHLTTKFPRAISAAGSNVAESIAPGQGKVLLQLAQCQLITASISCSHCFYRKLLREYQNLYTPP